MINGEEFLVVREEMVDVKLPDKETDRESEILCSDVNIRK